MKTAGATKGVNARHILDVNINPIINCFQVMTW